MKNFTEFQDLYPYPTPVDFRKSIDGLSYLVEQRTTLNPFDSALFLFCNKAKDKVKAILHCGTSNSIENGFYGQAKGQKP